MTYFKFYWLLIITPYLIYCVFKYINDQSSEMREYFEPQVKKFGFKITKIENLKSSVFSSPFKWVDEDIIVHPAMAGLGALRINYYPVCKRITIINQDQKEFTVNVALDFTGFHSKKLKRIRFNPKLETLL